MRHYYHVYADGKWWVPLPGHLDILESSGLYERVKPIRIGFVGSFGNIQEIKSYLHGRGIEFISVAEESEGWEQVTLDALYKDSLEQDFKVLYAHTKGAYYPSKTNEIWRNDMAGELIGKWKTASCLLESYDAVGIYWRVTDNVFAGNYWWANSFVIRTLGSCSRDNRWEAEAWLRHNKDLTVFDMKPGFPPLANYNNEAKVQSRQIQEEIESNLVTFRANSKFWGFLPGKTYTRPLTPLLKNVLRQGKVVTLISPPDLSRFD